MQNRSLFIIFITLLAFFPGAVTASGQEDEPAILKAAFLVNFPPQYLLSDSGKPAGFAFEVIDEVARLADFKIEYVIKESWQEMHDALRSGEVDLIPNQGITAQRKTWCSFGTPLEPFPVSFFVRKSTDDIKQFSDLYGRKVAVVRLNVALTILEKENEIISKVYPDAHDALFELLAGNVDALAYPEPVLQKMARSIGVDRQIKVMGSPLVEIKRAIAVKKGNTLLLARLDKAVSQFLNSGRYQEIYVKWHGEPAPSFWDNRKIIYLLGALFFLISSSLVLWRYRTLIGLNQKLEEQIGERKQVEERLIENEKNLEIIMDSMYVGIILIDPQNHRIVDINKYGLGMIGLPEDEVINKLCHDFINHSLADVLFIPDLAILQNINFIKIVFSLSYIFSRCRQYIYTISFILSTNIQKPFFCFS